MMVPTDDDGCTDPALADDLIEPSCQGYTTPLVRVQDSRLSFSHCTYAGYEWNDLDRKPKYIHIIYLSQAFRVKLKQFPPVSHSHWVSENNENGTKIA